MNAAMFVKQPSRGVVPPLFRTDTTFLASLLVLLSVSQIQSRNSLMCTYSKYSVGFGTDGRVMQRLAVYSYLLNRKADGTWNDW